MAKHGGIWIKMSKRGSGRKPLGPPRFFCSHTQIKTLVACPGWFINIIFQYFSRSGGKDHWTGAPRQRLGSESGSSHRFSEVYLGGTLCTTPCNNSSLVERMVKSYQIYRPITRDFTLPRQKKQIFETECSPSWTADNIVIKTVDVLYASVR